MDALRNARAARARCASTLQQREVSAGGGQDMANLDTEQLSRPTILVVEDDEDIRETIKFALELEHYGVTTAANGRDALGVLTSERAPSVILLDLMMPIMNGWDFARTLHQDEALWRIPIVVVTAYSERAAEIDAQGVIEKPVNLDALLSVVKRLCPRAPPPE
jgi:CheY-like chemotaxis protein